MKILVVDIETAPGRAFFFSRWRTNIMPQHVINDVRVLSFAAKWYGKNQIEFHAGDLAPGGSDRSMARRASQLLHEADAIVTFNGKSFDVPHLNRLIEGLQVQTPSPFKHIDLRHVAKKQFAFPYNSLAGICRELGIGSKVKHQGFELWIECLEGNPIAWAKMKKYNRHDVRLTEALYDRLLAWIPSHPSHALYENVTVCPQCGSSALARNGYAYTQTGKYQRYRCADCGSFPRNVKRIGGSDLTITTRG